MILNILSAQSLIEDYNNEYEKMKVEKLKVYRVVPFDEKVKVGEPAIPHKWEVKGEFKQKMENALELYRPKEYPPRDKCLYVCFSKDNAYEWAQIKYANLHRHIAYKLLTLEVTGELYWFMAEHYNLLRKDCTQEELCKACSSYWASMKENIADLIIGKEYEGLFVGENKIVDIKYKNFINGESQDV